MPNTIQIKRSSTASATPTSGQLATGELAINTADGRLFAKNSSNVVINLPVSSISGQDITPSTVDTTSLGTATAPAFSFSTDTNTGAYSPAADTYAISTAGTQRLLVNSSGFVGINIETPEYPLQVGAASAYASAYVSGTLYVSDIDGTAGKIIANSFGLAVYNNMGNGGSILAATCDVGISMGGDVIIRHVNGNFTQDEDSASGRLGIGVDTPTARLDVNGTALIRGRLQSPQTGLFLWQNFR